MSKKEQPNITKRSEHQWQWQWQWQRQLGIQNNSNSDFSAEFPCKMMSSIQSEVASKLRFTFTPVGHIKLITPNSMQTSLVLLLSCNLIHPQKNRQ